MDAQALHLRPSEDNDRVENVIKRLTCPKQFFSFIECVGNIERRPKSRFGFVILYKYSNSLLHRRRPNASHIEIGKLGESRFSARLSAHSGEG